MKQTSIIFLLTTLLSMAGANAFAYDEQIDGIYYEFSGNNAIVTYYSKNASANRAAYYGTITIPESITYNEMTYSVTGIGEDAFAGCKDLESVTIPNSVMSIGSWAFTGCTSLTSLSIPNSVTSIGSCAFSECNGLTSIAIGNSVTNIGSGAFMECTGLTSVTIPNSVKTIDSDAFRGCWGLRSVTIGNSVTNIGSGAFYGCHLASVTINSNAIMSKNSDNKPLFNTFGEQVTDFLIGEDVKAIGYGVFGGYHNLASVTISKNVTKISKYAFSTYIRIANLICRATIPPICEDNALYAIYKNYCTLIVPPGSLAAYKSANEWKDFNIIEESDVTAINGINGNGAESQNTHIYDTNGRKLESLQRGMNIIKLSDGTIKKVLVN